MQTRVVLVHGVGPFDEAQVLADVRSRLGDGGIAADCIDVVNWRNLAGDLSGEEDEFLAQIAAIARGVQGVVHLERAFPSTIARTLRNVVLLLPVIAPYLLLVPDRRFMTIILPAVITAFALLQFLMAVVRERHTILAALVSTVLPWLWMIGHAVVVVPYLFLRSAVGCSSCATMVIIPFVLVPTAMIVFRVPWLIVFVPPVVYFLASRGIHSAIFNRIVPLWRSSVERGLASGLLLAADVIRYLGDREYRDVIREKVVAAIDRPRERVIVVAHSLGSVIAADAVLSLTASCAAEMTLVTMGSPLLRLLHRLLPGEYPAPAGLRAGLVSRGVIQQWINVYRPADMVGAALFAGEAGDHATDVWFVGWLPPLHAHLNYWNDPAILGLILQGIASDAMPPTGEAVDREPLRNAPLPARTRGFERLVFAVLIVGAIGGYARVLTYVWQSNLESCGIACLAFIGFLLLFVVVGYLAWTIVVPYTFSLCGLQEGGTAWVPAVRKSRQFYEDTVLPDQDAEVAGRRGSNPRPPT